MLRDSSTTTDADLEALVDSIKASLHDQSESLIDLSVKLSVIDVAHEMQKNHALTLLDVYSSFQERIKSMLPVNPNPHQHYQHCLMKPFFEGFGNS